MVYPSTFTKTESAYLLSVRDRFRCPDEFLRYRLSGELSPDPGYFELSNGAVCYGRLVGAIRRTRPASCAPDSCASSSLGRGRLVLPFNPDEVVDNFRLERYPGCQLTGLDKALKNVYYRIRPLANAKLRSYVQRFRAANWKKRQFPQWPVDTTVEDIGDALLLEMLRAHRIDRIPFIWFWPDGARSCVLMTHDVETEAGRDYCTALRDLDDSFGIKSSFQVVPQERYSVSQKLLGQFRNGKHELCVHGFNHDGRLFDDFDEFRRRAALINCYAEEYGAKGFRSAVLYRRPEWLEYLRFSFDMSMPNVAHLDPQRGGCCTVMPYFIGQVLELPLTTIQDHTLFHVLNERSIDVWKLQLELILARNGLASFLVHPDYIIQPEAQLVYRKLLGMLNEMRGRESLWFALPGEVDSWWRQRSKMKVMREGHSWRIVGRGAERAQLAFARDVDGQLVYEFADARRDCAAGVELKRQAADMAAPARFFA